MPRFFFNLIEDAVIADDEGRDLPGVEAAHSEAVKSARDIACAEAWRVKRKWRQWG